MSQEYTRQENDDQMTWTTKDLECWINSGLVPKELSNPSKLPELIYFIRKNKEHLISKTQAYRENSQYKITIPADWENAYELKIVDKRTGEVVSILDRAEQFELCDGVSLTIKSTESEDWKKETADVVKLTKDQRKELGAFIQEHGKTRPLTRREIAIFIEEARKHKRIQKYRQSGHLVDQKLKAAKQDKTLSFEGLSPTTQQKIEDSKIEVTAEGIKLTPPENKLIHALNRILHEKSQNKDIKEEDFYCGNLPGELVRYGSLQTRAAVLKFRPAELYKAYLGTDKYSGHDISFINNTLEQLQAKKFLIKYDRVKKITKNNKTEELTDRIEDFQSLIRIISFIPDLTNEEKTLIDKGDTTIRKNRGEIIISLNPIFTDQIDTKFIEFPVDTNRRLAIAAGGHNRVTSSMNTLMELMMREMSAKRFKTEINNENLPYKLGLENYVKEKRKRRLQERIEKDVMAIVNMGIILRYEKVPNSSGGTKWVFHLNKGYT